MPRTCSVCTHDNRPLVERALVAGEPLRSISSRTGLTRQALARHRDGHMPAALLKAQEVEEVADADDLLAQVQRLHARTLAIPSDAERRGDQRTALQAVREARGNLELVAKLYALLASAAAEQPTIRIVDETTPIPDFGELEEGGGA